MKNLILTIYAICSAIFGVMAFIAPSTLLSFYGAPALDGVAETGYRYCGSALIGITMLCWYARSLEGSGRNAIITVLMVMNLLATITAYIGSVSGVFNSFAWAQLAFYAIFTILFFIASRSKESAMRPQTA